jgi:preprotein translocase subunit SecA
MVNLKNVEHDLTRYRRAADAAAALDTAGLSDAALLGRARDLRERAAGAPEPALLTEAFALVYEAARRALGLMPHPNQLTAAAAMADGFIIELSTGEGKTLAAVFTAALKALSGKGVHVLTFNDYLARRDADWMRPVYERLGLSVGCIAEMSDRAERRAAYACDVTYVTAKEAGFDYLRGFLGYEPEDLVQRPFYFAVVDEADSILIDEARIPLVIAGDTPAADALDVRLFRLASQMEPGVHFNTDENGSAVYLEESGIAFLEENLGLRDLYDDANLDVAAKAVAVVQAVHLLKRDVDYIVRGSELLLVDEYTGRVALGRQWSEGLHAAVGLKEGLTQTKQGKVMNSVTLQNFLRLYPDFAGMTGTAASAAAELLRFYGRSVAVVPPHRPCVRADRPDLVFTHKQAKYDAVVAEAVRARASGRPVLIGTSSIEESERLADLLRPRIPDIAVLNAKNDAAEAGVVANAGRYGAVTISTNMAGRRRRYPSRRHGRRGRGRRPCARRAVCHRHEPPRERADRQSAPRPCRTSGRSRRKPVFHKPGGRSRRPLRPL